MRGKTVVFIGVVMVMFLVLPIMAEPEAPSMEGYGASSGLGGTGIGIQSPVLDGMAFTNYDTVFMHGAMAENNLGSLGVFKEGDLGDCHKITLNPSQYNAYVNCPLYSYDSKQGGIYPAVRYLGLYFATEGAEISKIEVYNGFSKVKTIIFTPPLKTTTGFTVHVINLGEWIRFNRGLNMCLYVQNPSLTNTGSLYIGGYGARFEW